MDRSPPSMGKRLLRWLLGALGVVTLVRLLPSVFRLGLRRWLLGLLGEVLVVFLAGLVTQKVLHRRRPDDPSSPPASSSP